MRGGHVIDQRSRDVYGRRLLKSAPSRNPVHLENVHGSILPRQKIDTRVRGTDGPRRSQRHLAQRCRERDRSRLAATRDVRAPSGRAALDCRNDMILCSQIDIGNAATPLTDRMVQGQGVLQPDGKMAIEARMNADDVGRAVVYIASLPLDTNVLFMTVMANTMPFVGRG